MLSERGEMMMCHALDVAESCFMFVPALPVPRGQRLSLKITTEAVSIGCEGEVRYCRQRDPKTYREGVLLYPMSRMDRSKWNRLLLEKAAYRPAIRSDSDLFFSMYSRQLAGTSESTKMAVTGHSGSHNPQSMHSSGWMNTMSSPS